MRTKSWRCVALLAGSWLIAASAAAEPRGSAPAVVAPTLAAAPPAMPLARAPSLPQPQDKPYPGLVTLAVDASDISHRALHIQESIPVDKPGEMILLFPKWLPGNHGPTGPLSGLTGLSFRAGGRTLAWSRDPVEMFAFHITPPEGATTLEVSFDLVTPFDAREGRVVMTPAMLDLQWNMAVLYPAGYFSRGITIAPRLTLPTGWKFASALELEASGAEGVVFKPADLETLVDSPLFAGPNMQQFDLDPGGPAPVRLNVFADKPESLVARADEIAAHRNLVREAYRLFGARHFDHYDFLLGLSEQVSPIGLEHQRSSENVLPSRYFTDWEKSYAERDLLPHEFTHSWNGKFRRPEDLYTATYDTPMRDSMLWAYEGLTEYWGHVLGARSGLITRQQTLDRLAAEAAIYDNRPARRWRSLEDTTNEPIIAYKATKPWASWQRGTDYYREGALIWLDVDTLIREKTRGQRSLDDFARAFFGISPGEWATRTYSFQELTAALNAVAPNDWAGFLRSRLDRVGAEAPAPLDGLQRGGYRLVYGDIPTDSFRLDEARRRGCDLSYSLGVNLDQHGLIKEVQWDGPVFRAGLAPGSFVIAVNGMAFEPDGLKEAVRAAKTTTTPLELIVRTGDQFLTVRIDYHGGLRYPRLERDPATPARLDDILAPRTRRSEAG